MTYTGISWPLPLPLHKIRSSGGLHEFSTLWGEGGVTRLLDQPSRVTFAYALHTHTHTHTHIVNRLLMLWVPHQKKISITTYSKHYVLSLVLRRLLSSVTSNVVLLYVLTQSVQPLVLLFCVSSYSCVADARMLLQSQESSTSSIAYKNCSWKMI